MNKREKQRDVFVKLVNKQLEPHGKSYEDVKTDPEWYMRYKTNPADELAFINWGTTLIRKDLRLTKAFAEREMNWFILQWGLTTVQDHEQTIVAKPAKKASSKK